jgi:hypothetical protein
MLPANSMRKLLLAFSLVILIGTAIAATGKLIVTWPANDPAEGILAYCVYDNPTGTNAVKVATVVSPSWTTDVLPGLHIITVTASNKWGESDFSAPASYHGASAPRTISIGRQN